MVVIQSLAALTLTSVLVGCAGMPETRASLPTTRRSPDSCSGLLAEASALTADFADSSAARVAAAHSAYATKMAQYHTCLATAMQSTDVQSSGRQPETRDTII